MASNIFGTHFRIVTWGESHGPAIGTVIDGCPAGLPLTKELIQKELDRRRPGSSSHVTPRKEPDTCELLSGVYQGRTTGTPISILIRNQDARSEDYAEAEPLLKPGHAQFGYLKKYGCFDYRGGGRASGRETACRVAAGAVAKELLKTAGIQILGYLQAVGEIEERLDAYPHALESSLFCPSLEMEKRVKTLLDQTIEKRTSIGGKVGFITSSLPAGLGDPIFEKLEAKLASALLSIPASKGFEIGQGFDAVSLSGHSHNDAFTSGEGGPIPATNLSGGTLGGISTGTPLYGAVAFKPTSSIKRPQTTTTLTGEPATFSLPESGRHDPCIAIRAVPVVEAMVALVLADAYLMNRLARVESC